ncbi:hypothetical protein PR048_015112 [Dryococelus australis]|uniref:Cytochrome P450 n=1 Tax=Dryococelus australis TaxID=614101 RepID=A0ABQ9HGB4_9NEOP|nr:hypothetical protein PR048_015112 [Dryococelus australis]
MAWWSLLEIAAWLTVALCAFLWYSFTYWKRRGMPYVIMNVPMGIVWDVICQRKSYPEAYQGPYTLSDQPVVGFFELLKPVLMIRDLDLIKEILVREFPSFHDRGLFIDEKVDPLSANLFFLKGSRWRSLRAKLTPTFTSGKVKAMLPAVAECGDELCTLLLRSSRCDAAAAVEVKDAVARFTTDVIATCAFGVEGGSLADPNAEVRHWGVRCFEPTLEVILRNLLSFVLPGVASFLGIRTTPSGVTEFFSQLVEETVAARQANDVSRPDFLQLLIQLKNTPLSTAADDDASEAGGGGWGGVGRK